MKILIKGAGDLATGIAARLHACGYKIVMTEIAVPLTVRRSVAFSRAVYEGEAQVEDVRAVLVRDLKGAEKVLEEGRIAVIVDETASIREAYQPEVVIDAVMAKRNIGTCITDAPLVIGIGPGFTAGEDCHFVIETKRGHDLGRVIAKGCAIPDTGVPGEIGGYASERLIRAQADGIMEPCATIGDVVEKGQKVAETGRAAVYAEMTGIVRGMLQPGVKVTKGLKIGDIDARQCREYCETISDKARSIGGGVLEAVTRYERQKYEWGSRYAIILLAAGSSVRYGANKLLEETGGMPMYQHMLKALSTFPALHRIVVSRYPEILEDAERLGMQAVVNQQPALGISHSLILGLREAMAENPDLKGVLFAVCDQPELKADTISRLLRKAQENPGKIVCAGRNGRPGNPVVWDQRYFKELLGLAGDTGGRQVMKNYPGDILVLETAEEELRDIDRKEDMTE